MKLKRNIIPKYIGIALLILTCLIFTVPELMLRAAVFCAAPSYAFSVEFEEAKEIEVLDQVDEHTKIYKIIKNALPDANSEVNLVNWVLHSYGPFHVAYYYGW